MIDTGVYTRNRAFRFIWSCKFNKTATLEVLHKYTQEKEREMENERERERERRDMFLDCMIVPAVIECPIDKDLWFMRMTEAQLIKTQTLKQRHSKHTAHSQKSRGEREREREKGISTDRLVKGTTYTIKKDYCGVSPLVSPFPSIDKFILSIVNSNGRQGSIRGWRYTSIPPHTNIQTQSQSQSPSTSSSTLYSQSVVGEQKQREVERERDLRWLQRVRLLTYQVDGNRYCENIHREHKSNNIMLVVDVTYGVYYQRCWDPDCQQIDYRSVERQLPVEAIPNVVDVQNVDFDVDVTNDINNNPHKWKSVL